MKFPQPLKLLSFWSVMSGDGKQFSIFLTPNPCIPEIVCSYLSISLLNCKAPHLNLSMRNHFRVQTTESYPVFPTALWNLSFLLGHSPRVRLPRKGQCAGCKKPATFRQPHLFNRVHSTPVVFLPTFCKRSITGKQAWRAMWTNWGKKNMEPERWLSKKLSDKPFAQSTEFYFMIMKSGQLNSKGKPHVRQKHFKSFLLPSHTAVK